MTVFNFALKRYFRKRSNIFFLFFLPIAMVFLPDGGWLPLPLGFQYYGILLLFIAVRLTSIIMEDRMNKTLFRMGVAPFTHFQYLWQNLLAYSLILIGVNIAVVILGIIVHGEKLIGPMLLFIIYSFFSIISIGFSLAWYSLFRNKETANSILTGVFVLMAMLGGILWPVEIMPIAIQRLTMFLPTYWLAEGLIVVSFGGSFIDLVLPLGMTLMLSLVFLLLGSRRRIA